MAKTFNSQDGTAVIVQRMLRDRYGKTCNNQTLIARAGLELDLIECYLKGMTILSVVDWMKTERNFTTSKSVVGRYWVKLRSVEAYKYRT